LLQHARGRILAKAGRSIDLLVSRLRRKLDGSGSDSLIQTVRGEGYRFDAMPGPRAAA
jgi:two-component system OmpR family response regulator